MDGGHPNSRCPEVELLLWVPWPHETPSRQAHHTGGVKREPQLASKVSGFLGVWAGPQPGPWCRAHVTRAGAHTGTGEGGQTAPT